MQFTLTGYHLSGVKEIQLFAGSEENLLRGRIEGERSSSQLSSTINSSDDELKKKASEKDGVKLTVGFIAKYSQNAVRTNIVISLKSSQASGSSIPDSNGTQRQSAPQRSPQNGKPPKKGESANENRAQ